MICNAFSVVGRAANNDVSQQIVSLVTVGKAEAVRITSTLAPFTSYIAVKKVYYFVLVGLSLNKQCQSLAISGAGTGISASSKLDVSSSLSLDLDVSLISDRRQNLTCTA